MKGVLLVTMQELRTLPIWEFEKPLREKFVALKVIAGYEFDNTHLRIEIGCGEYAMSLNRSGCKYGSIGHKELQETFGDEVDISKVYEITIWNWLGTQTSAGV